MQDFIPFSYTAIPAHEQLQRAREFYELCRRRRTIREYSDKLVSKELLEFFIKTAAAAPSGANKQPWRFVIVTDPTVKHEIRVAAETEERDNYEHRMPQEWLEDLGALGTDWHKEFLEIAPALIVVFGVNYEKGGDRIRKNYYVKRVCRDCSGIFARCYSQRGACFTHAHTESDGFSHQNSWSAG